MTVQLRAPRLPDDYPAIARLLSSYRGEPTTVEMLAKEDQVMPSHDIDKRDEDGLLAGFCRVRVVAVDERDEVIGYAASWRAPWAPPGALGSHLAVDPQWRGRGIGEQLRLHLEGWAQEKGASLLMSELWEQVPEAKRFVEKRGYELERHFFQSTLDVPTFDEAHFAGVAEAVERTGLRFGTMRDVQDEAELFELMKRTYRDIPGILEEPQYEEWKEYVEAGAHDHVWVALDGERLAGMTQLIPVGEQGGLYNWYTGVDADYRGRGLALALKLLAIRTAKEQGATYLRTDNDSENVPMLAVNRKLGYVPAPGHYRIRKFF